MQMKYIPQCLLGQFPIKSSGKTNTMEQAVAWQLLTPKIGNITESSKLSRKKTSS